MDFGPIVNLVLFIDDIISISFHSQIFPEFLLCASAELDTEDTAINQACPLT